MDMDVCVWYTHISAPINSHYFYAYSLTNYMDKHFSVDQYGPKWNPSFVMSLENTTRLTWCTRLMFTTILTGGDKSESTYYRQIVKITNQYIFITGSNLLISPLVTIISALNLYK